MQHLGCGASAEPTHFIKQHIPVPWDQQPHGRNHKQTKLRIHQLRIILTGWARSPLFNCTLKIPQIKHTGNNKLVLILYPQTSCEEEISTGHCTENKDGFDVQTSSTRFKFLRSAYTPAKKTSIRIQGWRYRKKRTNEIYINLLDRVHSPCPIIKRYNLANSPTVRNLKYFPMLPKGAKTSRHVIATLSDLDDSRATPATEYARDGATLIKTSSPTTDPKIN